MKTKLQILVAGLFLASVGTGVGQPCITITNQPQNQTPCYGTTAIFKVGATGAEPLSYQWQQSGDGANFTDRPAATKSTLEIPNVQGSDTGVYRATSQTRSARSPAWWLPSSRLTSLRFPLPASP